jgi:O-antigen/teichoic acid export membrane protein
MKKKNLNKALKTKMAAATLKQKTAKGLFWGGISNGAQQLIGLVFGIFLARILNEDDYGLFGMLTIFTAIASTIINSGFSIALTNKQDASHQDYNAVFWFTVFMGLFLYIILFFSAPLIAKFYGNPELVDLSRFLFIGFFFSGMGTVFYTIMFKKLMVKQQAIIDILALLTAAGMGLFAAIKGLAYWALAIQTVVHVSLASLLRFFIAPWKPTWEFTLTPVKEMFSFSIKMFFTNIFIQINNNILSVIIGKFFGKEQLGIYYQGQKWMGMGSLFVGGMINHTAQPILVQLNEDRERQVNVLRKMIRFGAFVSFPMLLGLAFIGKEFILISIGEKWAPSIPFLQLFCIWGAFSYLWNLYTNVIFTHGKSGMYMRITILSGFLQLIAIIVSYSQGLFPMAMTYVAMCFVGLMLWQRSVSQLIGLRFKDVLKDISPYLGITTGCFLAVWLLTKNIENLYLLLVLKITLSGIFYLLIMKWSHSVIFKESINYLMNFIEKK